MRRKKPRVSKEKEREWLIAQVEKTIDNVVYDTGEARKQLLENAIKPMEYDTLIHDSIEGAVETLLCVFKLRDPSGYWSVKRVKQELKKFGLKYAPFRKWMFGQTCPILLDGTGGVYQWDVERYIEWKVKGVTPVFD